MKQTKAFLVHYDKEVIVCRLSDAEAGKLFKALFPYGREKLMPDFNNSPALAMAFDILRMTIDQDKEKHVEKCERNRKNIEKRWKKKDTTVYDGIPMYTNNTNTNTNINTNTKKDNKEKEKKERPNLMAEGSSTPPVADDPKDPKDTTVYDGISDKTNDNNGDKERHRFIPPSVSEVRAYCQEKGYKIDADQFIDFYESKGWMVGKNKMKDWKAAVRTWTKRRTSNEQPAARNKFNNFNQRQYDYESLERQLLE